MSDIVDEMKNWRDERGYPTPGEMLDRAIAEITRLRAEVERLRLTDAEGEAVQICVERMQDSAVKSRRDAAAPPRARSARLGGGE